MRREWNRWATILGSLSALLLQYLAVSCPNHASHISEISLYLLSFPPSWSHQLSSLIGLQQQHRFELQELKTIRLKIQINGRSKSQNMLIKYNTWVLEQPGTEFQLPVSLNIHGILRTFRVFYFLCSILLIHRVDDGLRILIIKVAKEKIRIQSVFHSPTVYRVMRQSMREGK